MRRPYQLHLERPLRANRHLDVLEDTDSRVTSREGRGHGQLHDEHSGTGTSPHLRPVALGASRAQRGVVGSVVPPVSHRLETTYRRTRRARRDLQLLPGDAQCTSREFHLTEQEIIPVLLQMSLRPVADRSRLGVGRVLTVRRRAVHPFRALRLRSCRRRVGHAYPDRTKVDGVTITRDHDLETAVALYLDQRTGAILRVVGTTRLGAVQLCLLLLVDADTDGIADLISITLLLLLLALVELGVPDLSRRTVLVLLLLLNGAVAGDQNHPVRDGDLVTLDVDARVELLGLGAVRRLAARKTTVDEIEGERLGAARLLGLGVRANDRPAGRSQFGHRDLRALLPLSEELGDAHLRDHVLGLGLTSLDLERERSIERLVLEHLLAKVELGIARRGLLDPNGNPDITLTGVVTGCLTDQLDAELLPLVAFAGLRADLRLGEVLG